MTTKLVVAKITLTREYNIPNDLDLDDEEIVEDYYIGDGDDEPGVGNELIIDFKDGTQKIIELHYEIIDNVEYYNNHPDAC